MGAVKPSSIKSIALQLLEEFPSDFTLDIETNKRIIAEKTNIRSKNIRNRVAGYICTLKKIQERKEKEKEEGKR
jgi:small subunit ribosomal protein S17e